MTLDIYKHRAAKNYTSKEQLMRVVWGCLGKPLFRLSPRPFFSYRRAVLRTFGAKLGNHVNLYPTTIVYFPWNLEIGEWSAIAEDVLIYNLGKVKIGKRVFVSHRAQICAGTHDYNKADFPLLKLPINIMDQAWVCTQAFIGPGVTIGEGAIIGACAVVMRDVPSWKIVAGNPATAVKDRPVI